MYGGGTCREGSDPVVAVAASAGGVEALIAFVSHLGPGIPAPILVAQHLARSRKSQLREILQRHTDLSVEWAASGLRAAAGSIYLAPPDRNLVIDAERYLRVASPGPRERPCSADVLFGSVAEACGRQAIAVVLTGCLRDGAAGAQRIRKAGGRVFVQLPETCCHSSMPLAAMETGAVDLALPVETLASAVSAIATAPVTSCLLNVGEGFRARNRQMAAAASRVAAWAFYPAS